MEEGSNRFSIAGLSLGILTWLGILAFPNP